MTRVTTATIKIRRGADWNVRPELEQFDGQTVPFEFGWRITKEDRPQYAGEDAWIVARGHPLEQHVLWIASGDLVFPTPSSASGE